MPVVLHHRKTKQKRKFFFWNVNRWYQTTGIRLRQASCRTRKPKLWSLTNKTRLAFAS